MTNPISNVFKLEDVLAEAFCPNRNNEFSSGAALVEVLLAEAAAQAVKAEKPASLSIQIAIQSMGGGQVGFKAKITSKLPELNPTTVLAYVDKAGRLVSEDTRQTTIVDLKAFHKG